MKDAKSWDLDDSMGMMADRKNFDHKEKLSLPRWFERIVNYCLKKFIEELKPQISLGSPAKLPSVEKLPFPRAVLPNLLIVSSPDTLRRLGFSSRKNDSFSQLKRSFAGLPLQPCRVKNLQMTIRL